MYTDKKYPIHINNTYEYNNKTEDELQIYFNFLLYLTTSGRGMLFERKPSKLMAMSR